MEVVLGLHLEEQVVIHALPPDSRGSTSIILEEVPEYGVVKLVVHRIFSQDAVPIQWDRVPPFLLHEDSECQEHLLHGGFSVKFLDSYFLEYVQYPLDVPFIQVKFWSDHLEEEVVLSIFPF